MLELAMDTSNKTLSVAVLLENQIVDEITIQNTLQHSVRLMPAVEELLQRNRRTMQEVETIIVAKGPGSYTGLRVGATVAKTLAYAMNANLKSVSSLALIASNVEKTKAHQLIVPVFDARRQFVYTGAYQWQGESLVCVEKERYIAWPTWLDCLSHQEGSYYVVGDQPDNFKEMAQQYLGNRMIWGSVEEGVPRASHLFDLAQQVKKEDVDLFVPSYLKLAEAEENWRAAHPESQEDGYVERI